MAMETQHPVKPRIFECDNEIVTTKPGVLNVLLERGIRVEPSAPDTQAQNGGAERAGGVIETKARSMRAGAKLPEDLWIDIISAAIYLYN